MTIETEPVVQASKSIIDPPVPEGVNVTKDQMKRGRGRPAKPFISELPRPPKFEITKTDKESAGDIFFRYLRSIPKEKLNRITLTFYRYHPVEDSTQGGTKTKEIDLVAGESHKFQDDDWESQLLHQYGCGIYGCYLNEMNRTICRCLRIETRWDPDNYPPLVDPEWLDMDAPQNKAYIQYLRQRGIKLPTKLDKEEQENEMQMAGVVDKLTDAVLAQNARMNTPVPQRESMGEKLTFEAAKSAIDIVADQAKNNNAARTQEGNPLELVNALVNVADKMRGGNGSDDTLKLFLQDSMRRAEASEKRSNDLLDKLISRDSTPPKNDLKDFLENMKLAREAFGPAEKESSEENPGNGKSSFAQTLLEAVPTIVPPLLGLIDRGMMMFQMMRSPATSQLQQPHPTTQPNGPPNPYGQPQTIQQAMKQEEQRQAAGGTGAPPAQAPVSEQPVTPIVDTRTPEQIAQEEQARQQYAQFAPFLSAMAPAIVSHLNDQGETDPDTGQLVRKNGYDFADWVISGYQRISYDQIKAVGPDMLLGAIKSYAPLWQQIGGIEVRVQQFIGEFMTYDEFMAQQNNEGDGEED